MDVDGAEDARVYLYFDDSDDLDYVDEKVLALALSRLSGYSK